MKMESLKKAINVLYFVMTVLTSFVLGFMANDINRQVVTKPNPFNNIQSSEQTSISVSDRGELLIIKRVNGETIVLDNSVGMNIFKAYANAIYNQNSK